MKKIIKKEIKRDRLIEKESIMKILDIFKKKHKESAIDFYSYYSRRGTDVEVEIKTRTMNKTIKIALIGLGVIALGIMLAYFLTILVYFLTLKP